MRRLILTGLLLALATPAHAELIDKHFHETFDVDPGVKLVVHHGDGDLRIEPWDRDVIEVDVIYQAEEHTWGFGEERDFEVEFSQTKNTVQVRERRRSAIRIGVHTTHDRVYEYTIRAPAYVALELRGDDGDVEVENWEADADVFLDDGRLTIDGMGADKLAIELEDGEVRLLNVDSELHLRADDASIRLTECQISQGDVKLEDGDFDVRQSEGNFEIDIDDGSVDFDACRVHRLRVEAEDATLSFDGLRVDEMDWDIRSDDGDVKVVLEDETSVTFRIEADDGDIDLDLSDTASVKEGRHHASGALHGGEGELRIRTQDGQVRLRQRG